MNTVLVVVQPFADYQKGDRITDTKTMAAVLKDHEHRVVQIQAPKE